MSWLEARQAGKEAPAVHCVKLAGKTSTIQARLHMLPGLTTATGPTLSLARPLATVGRRVKKRGFLSEIGVTLAGLHG